MSPEAQARAVLTKPYSRVVKPDEAGGYFAQIVEFPGCVSEGETHAEALANLEAAAIDWVNAALDQGLQLPEPLQTTFEDWLKMAGEVWTLPTRAERQAHADRVRAEIGNHTDRLVRWNFDVCDGLDVAIASVR